MPSRFRVKQYISDGIYHIYNRGLDGRQVFSEPGDYLKFIELCRNYVDEVVLGKPAEGFKGVPAYLIERKKNVNLHGEVEIMVFCLLPDHFHLLLRQKSERGITKFMRRVLTGYVMYFNEKYKRRGGLFEGIYKAAMVGSVTQAAHLSGYIHLNPASRSVRKFGLVETVTSVSVRDYPYSSYQMYLGGGTGGWVNSLSILEEVENIAGSGVDYGDWVEKGGWSERELGGVLLD